MDHWQDGNDSVDSKILYVGNLDERVTGAMMLDIFQKGLGTEVASNVEKAEIQNGNDPYQPDNQIFCFVHFKDHQSAEKAREFINGKEFFQKTVVVKWCAEGAAGSTPKALKPGTTNVSIYVGDLDDEVDDGALKKFFEAWGEVMSVKVVRDSVTFASKGFGFVSFASKDDATVAIDSANGMLLGKRTIKTNWASRNKTTNAAKYKLEDVLLSGNQSNTSIYVGSLPGGISPDRVKDKFTPFGTIIDTRIFIDKGYAFIKFRTHEEAGRAITEIHGSDFDGSVLKVWWGKEQVPAEQRDSNDLTSHQQQQQFSAMSPAAVPMVERKGEGRLLTKEQKREKMAPMFAANGMQYAQQEHMLNYMQIDPDYYDTCMASWERWVTYAQQCQQHNLMVHQSTAQSAAQQIPEPAIEQKQAMQQMYQPDAQQIAQQFSQAMMQQQMSHLMMQQQASQVMVQQQAQHAMMQQQNQNLATTQQVAQQQQQQQQQQIMQQQAGQLMIQQPNGQPLMQPQVGQPMMQQQVGQQMMQLQPGQPMMQQVMVPNQGPQQMMQTVQQPMMQTVSPQLMQNGPQQVPQNVPQQLTQIVPQHAMRATSQSVPQQIVQSVPQQVAQNAPQHPAPVMQVTQNVTQQMTQNVTQQVIQTLPQHIMQSPPQQQMMQSPPQQQMIQSPPQQSMIQSAHPRQILQQNSQQAPHNVHQQMAQGIRQQMLHDMHHHIVKSVPHQITPGGAQQMMPQQQPQHQHANGV